MGRAVPFIYLSSKYISNCKIKIGWWVNFGRFDLEVLLESIKVNCQSTVGVDWRLFRREVFNYLAYSRVNSWKTLIGKCANPTIHSNSNGFHSVKKPGSRAASSLVEWRKAPPDAASVGYLSESSANQLGNNFEGDFAYWRAGRLAKEAWKTDQDIGTELEE